MDWGAFAGGVGGGLEQGKQLADAYRKRQQQILESQLLQKQVQGMGQPGAPPTPVPMPGASPMPAAQGNPIGAPGFASVAPPGGAPPQGGMPTPMPGGAPPPMGGPPGAAPPMAAPGAQMPPAPQATPVSPPGGGGPAPAIGMSDTTTDPQAILKSVALDIYRADPTRKWQRSELLDAVNDRIEQMKGVDPSARIAAQAQIAGSKEALAYWERQSANDTSRANTQDRVAAQERGQDMAAKSKADAMDAAMARVKAAGDIRLKTQAMQDATRIQAEQLIQGGADARAANMIDFRNKALEAGMNEKEWQAQLSAQLKEQGMSDAFVGKLFTAQSANAEIGKGPAAPARPKVTGAGPPPKIGSGGAAPVKVKTPEEANKLKPGTVYVTPDGQQYTR